MEIFLTYLLPAAYLWLGIWLVLKMPGRVSKTFTPGFISFFVGLKVATGLLYTWVMLRFIPSATADIDLFFGDSLHMYHTFWQNPSAFPSFLKEQFYISDFDLARTDSDFIRTVFEGIKLIHFGLNFFSGGLLFTNVLLFNVLSSFLFLRCWAWMLEKWNDIWPGVWLFLLPSAFFFTSVILKEGIEWCLIAAILPALDKLFTKFRVWQLPGLILMFALLFFYKYLIAATFCGGLILFTFYTRFPKFKFSISIVAMLVSGLLFFNLKHLHPALDFPAYILERRLEFAELEANSALSMKDLSTDGLSFLKALPEALRNVLLRPLPGEEGKFFYLAFTLELFIFWGLVFFLMYRIFASGTFNPPPFALAVGLFCLANLLIIGYTITNTGAIIRYRSIFIPGIILCLWPYRSMALCFLFDRYILKGN